MTLKLRFAVTCPACQGDCYVVNAVAECGDRTAVCETCNASGRVPGQWATMYAYSHDKTCDYCGEPRGAAWDGELFSCVGCWEGKREH